MDEWDDLKIVLMIARHGGLSAAARALGTTHSTVSRRLAGAETRMGVRLFDRLSGGTKPTEAGERAVEAAERMEAEMLALDLSLMTRDTGLSGKLRITAPQLIIDAHLAEALARFRRQYQAIDLEISAANEILNLHRREADVAIRVSDAPEPSLVGRIVARQRRGFYVSRDYAEMLAGRSNAEGHREAVDCVAFSWWGNQPPEPVSMRYPLARVSVCMDDMIAVKAAVRAGMGIGRMPCFVGGSDTSLVRLTELGFEPYMDVWVLTHPDLKGVERIRRFMQFIAGEFQARSRLYMGE